MAVAKTHQEKLETIKKNVKNNYEAFKANYERFHEFRRFIFETSLTQDDITLLTNLSKPQIEFNISEAYISRLMGEFSKQEPSVRVGSEDESSADPTVVHIVEAHIRHILRDNKNTHKRWEIMKDIYSGGFSVGKLYTKYAHPMSMKQVFEFDRVYDPTLCGFDQMARYSHKGDGRFCFELMPYEVEDFKQQNPGINIDKLNFNRSFAGFNWSYLNGNEKTLLCCDYYEKKKKETKIMELVTGQVVTAQEYEELMEEWERNGNVEQLPAVRGKSRWTTIETICRYRCIETEVIEYTETDYTMFPLVFFDGNSIMLRNPKTSGAVQQITRPYVYHAKGAQKLKNFAGITLANSIENIVQHKFMVAKEALPKEQDWLEAYKDIQKPANLVFNAFFEQDPDKPIPNPIMPIPMIPAPPEVTQTFQATDSLIQNILGSYDASLGINDNQLSGVAIIEAATQSNAAAMPYVVGFLQGLQRIAELIVDLIPKYYKTPRSIPVMGIDGKCDYVKVNQEEGASMFYDTNMLNVSVEAGVSFQIQKSRALQQLIALQQSSPLFAQFMNEKGLNVLLDNIEIRGIDQLKMMVEEWLQELAKQKQLAMQQQQQQAANNPIVMKNNIEMAKMQQKQQETTMKAQVSEKQFQLDMQRLKQDQMKVLSDISIAQENSITQRIKSEAERFSKQVDLALKHKDMDLKKKDMLHRHFKESIETHHDVHLKNHTAQQQAQQQENNGEQRI
jgi:uncharacterized protein YeaO (DUF488 family)